METKKQLPRRCDLPAWQGSREQFAEEEAQRTPQDRCIDDLTAYRQQTEWTTRAVLGFSCAHTRTHAHVRSRSNCGARRRPRVRRTSRRSSASSGDPDSEGPALGRLLLKAVSS